MTEADGGARKKPAGPQPPNGDAAALPARPRPPRPNGRRAQTAAPSRRAKSAASRANPAPEDPIRRLVQSPPNSIKSSWLKPPKAWLRSRPTSPRR